MSEERQFELKEITRLTENTLQFEWIIHRLWSNTVSSFWITYLLELRMFTIGQLLFSAKPLATDLTKLGQPEYMQRIFRRACAWSAFTVDRDQTSFKYNYFMCEHTKFVSYFQARCTCWIMSASRIRMNIIELVIIKIKYRLYLIDIRSFKIDTVQIKTW